MVRLDLLYYGIFLFKDRFFLEYFLIYIFLFLQIEDAMLMFDKQTNRHRGEFAFHLSVWTMLQITRQAELP